MLFNMLNTSIDTEPWYIYLLSKSCLNITCLNIIFGCYIFKITIFDISVLKYDASTYG
jgi:hypothetical protein